MPKCKCCKQRFEPLYFLQRYCLNGDKCIKAFNEYVKREKELKWKKEKKVLKENLLTKKDHLNILQKVFNTFIRLRDKGKPCISCDKFLKPNDINAGHFYSVGAYPNLRFNENNTHAQCIECNLHKHGNVLEYDLRLPNRIGIESYQELKESRNKPILLGVEEVKELVKTYKTKISNLKSL